MNLLLLLSALLSALAGVGGSARQPQAAQAVSQSTRVAVVATRHLVAAARPEQKPAGLAAVACAPLSAVVCVQDEPRYVDRRRE